MAPAENFRREMYGKMASCLRSANFHWTILRVHWAHAQIHFVVLSAFHFFTRVANPNMNKILQEGFLYYTQHIVVDKEKIVMGFVE